MMPTPVIYEGNELDPFAHLAPSDRTSSLSVLYATTRAALPQASPPYGNEVGHEVLLGTASVAFGSQLAWEDLHRASTHGERGAPIELQLADVTQWARLGLGDSDAGHGLDAFAGEVDRRLALSLDPEIFVYVHGARVDFYRCCVRTAQLQHFAGRDLVGIAFDWPSHQSILSYALGEDRRRAKDAAASLAALIEFLSQRTSAKRIHVLGYSAGGETVAEGLSRLRQSHADLAPEALRERLRIGTVIFAASDVSIDEFERHLPGVHDLARRVVVTTSDEDGALQAAKHWMGGGARIGDQTSESALARLLAEHENLEIVDVSHGKETRGFDITGHHYWHAHPWVASDLILNLRVDRPAAERGLQSTGSDGIWYLQASYPDDARGVLRRELDGSWQPRP